MPAPSLDVEVLNATLAAAETQVRWLMADALTPAAIFRIEQRSTTRARAALHAARGERRLEVAPGWAEFVDVEQEIDALLARLVRPEAPLEVTLAAREPVPYVPPLAPVVSAEPSPAAAAIAPPDHRPARPRPAPVAPLAVPGAAPVAHYPPDQGPVVPHTAVETHLSPHVHPPQEPAAAWGHEEGSYGYEDYDEEYQSYDAADGYAPPHAHHEWPAPDPSPATPPAELPTPPPFEEPRWQAPAPSQARREPQPAIPVAVVLPPPPAPDPEPDFGFSQTDWVGRGDDLSAHRRAEPTSVHWSRADHGFSLDQPEQSDDIFPDDASLFARTGRPLDEDILEEAVERTHAELTLDLPNADLDEDDLHDPTSVVPRAPARPVAAAVRLNTDGTAQVLGAPPNRDEPTMSSAIALGDASDYGDEDIPDLPSGAMGLLHYDDPDDDDADYEPSQPTVPTQGAPRLAASDIELLLKQAREASTRNVAEAVLLYGDVLDADPGHTAALVARGRLHIDLGDLPRAISDLLRAEERGPENAEVQSALGDFFFARKDYRRACDSYDAALRAQPDRPETLYRRGMSHYYRRNFQPAVDDLEKAKRLDPRLPQIETYLDRARRKQV